MVSNLYPKLSSADFILKEQMVKINIHGLDVQVHVGNSG